MVFGAAAKAFGQLLFDEAEIRPGFADRPYPASSLRMRKPARVRIKQLVFVWFIESRVDIGLGHAFHRGAGGKLLTDAGRDAQQQSPYQGLPVLEAPVHCRRVRVRAARHGAHSQCLVASPLPQGLSSFQNALFEIGIGMSGHSLLLSFWSLAVAEQLS